MNELVQTIETELSKPNVLSLDGNNNIIMTLTWDDWEQKFIKLEDFLHLTDLEKKEIRENYTPLWYTLVWDKRIWWDHPEYFKNFHDQENNKRLFSWSKEITRKRDIINEDDNTFLPDRELRELIFVKLNLPENISEKVTEETMCFKATIKKILAGLTLTK